MQVATPWASSLPLVGGGQLRLRGRLFAAAVEDARLAQHAAGVAGDRPHELGLEAERGVGDAGRQGRVDGAAEGRVEQGRRVAAVDDADRVVVLLPGLALEDDAALLELDRAQPHRHRDRRRRQLAGDDRAHVLHAGHRRPGRRGRHRVLPDQGAAARGLRAGGRERLGDVGRGRSPARTTPSALTGRRLARRRRRRLRRRARLRGRVVQVGGDLRLADRDARRLAAVAVPVSGISLIGRLRSARGAWFRQATDCCGNPTSVSCLMQPSVRRSHRAATTTIRASPARSPSRWR